jgi:hypothetical protein
MAWLSLVLFLAAPASAQQLMARSFTPALPVLPALGGLSASPFAFSAAPVLSLSPMLRLDAAPLVLPPVVSQSWQGLQTALQGPILSVPDGLIQQAGASGSFAALVRAQLAEAVPSVILRDIQARGYVVLVKDHLTQGRPDLKPFFDYTGGLTDWGPLGDFVMVAERTKKDGPEGTSWIDNRNWRNSAVHECGHAVDNINRFTDKEAFRDAWDEDLRAMPEAVKRPAREDGGRNDFYYFLNPDIPGYAYRETFAEGFDVLLRGEASSFNHDDFHRYFPRTLAAMRRLLEARYGPIVVESPHAH